MANRRGKGGVMTDFLFLGSKITTDGDCSHEVRRRLLLGRKAKGFPGGTSGKEPVSHCRRLRDLGSIPGLGRSSGEGHGNPLQYPGEGYGNALQYSCLRILWTKGAWKATVHGVAKSQTPVGD